MLAVLRRSQLTSIERSIEAAHAAGLKHVDIYLSVFSLQFYTLSRDSLVVQVSVFSLWKP